MALRCGRTFTETIRELKLGAAMEWADQMKEDHQSSLATSVSPASWGARAYLFFGLGRRSTPPNRLPTSRSNPSPLGAGATHRQRPPAARRSEYVLLCIKAAGTRLFHADITDKTTDEEMFRELHERYRVTQVWYKKLLSLKKLQRIEFVRFNIYYGNRVAISKNDVGDMPPLHNSEYRFLPRPPDNDPIIPHNALLHFFQHPSHAGSKSFHRERIVKRINELTLGPDRGLKVGWGIRFKEKLCWRKVFLLEAVICVAGVVVGLLWYFCRADVQGATGITAVVLWIGTVVLGLAHGVSEGSDASRES